VSEDLTTYEVILRRMLSRVPDEMDKREGSIIWDALAPAALELAQQYDVFQNLIKQAFISTSTGEYLDFGAGDLGLTRSLDEDDESFRPRALYLKRNPEKGGADTDYERWALSVAGVQYARSIDKARGLGTVDVIVSGLPDTLNQLVIDVQTLVDKKKPSGVDAKVKKVTLVTKEFTISVEGLSQEDAATVALTYLNAVGVGGTAILSKLVTALIQAGASDAVVTEPTSNVSLPPDSILDPVVVIP